MDPCGSDPSATRRALDGYRSATNEAERGVYEWAVVWGAASVLLCSHYNSHHALFRQKHRDAFCMTACRQLSAS